MKVKKYVAPTMPEAMSRIRKELGKDAVILSSKEIQEGGVLGFFKKRKIEVVAALDQKPIPKRQPNIPKRTPQPDTVEKKQNVTVESEVIQEIRNMKRMLEQQSLQQKVGKFELDYQAVFQYLLDQEVDEAIASSIMENVIKKHKETGIAPDYPTISKDVQTEIETMLSDLSFHGFSNSAKVVHFIGPTGVGKTTTIAKVAANRMLQEKKKVALITMDTYRIAAIEQLKTYAKILETPLEVVYSVDDYQNAIKKFQNYDLILVDTAGRNYRDEQYVKELTKTMRTDQQVENYLVLSLTSKPKDMHDIYHSFRHVDISGLIFTKIDETRQYGSLLNIPLTEKLDIAFITNGQEVPDNIIKPTKEVISNYIVGDLIGS
ncbi:flagellar biosynthesis protein FlhF [Ornithinibacillus contaminans]|uniref:flagellar biosynthesis protein FlhF n=1 Tax=Ornithinibacillus contaminans TaxID=694055 RepID=UPI00064DE3F9|nr:flagellar biosynthesis protein FlhF [Ornithinibacillus contaminans]